VIIWGAGMIGRRLSKHLVRNGALLKAFLEVDSKKVGKTLRGLPIRSYESLSEVWAAYEKPVVLAAVGARGARGLIRDYLEKHNLREGRDWWGVA
jgi:NADH/NAD ratio-sensing transcriptional regulator Rex